MDKLEEANNRLLARREQLKESTQTELTPLSTQISSFQSKIEKIISERPIKYCACGVKIHHRLERCHDCSEKIRQEEEKAKEKKLLDEFNSNKDDYLDKIMIKIGIPKMFLCAPPVIEHKSLFITGGFGIGKTHYSVSVLRGYLDAIKPHKYSDCYEIPCSDYPIFTTTPELLLTIRTSLDDEQRVVSKFSDVRLLIIDDLGAEKTTDWALQSLYVILNRRYTQELQTIITSNLNLDEVKEKLGDRIASRIAGMCNVLQLSGKDKRLIPQKKKEKDWWNSYIVQNKEKQKNRVVL